MLKVEDMSPAEMHALLRRESFGHLGCAARQPPLRRANALRLRWKRTLLLHHSRNEDSIHRRESAGLFAGRGSQRWDTLEERDGNWSGRADHKTRRYTKRDETHHRT